MTLKEFFKRDRFAVMAGCELLEIREGYARACMTVEEHHLNGGDFCQGGALFTLADLAIAALMNSQGKLTFGISNSIMFIASAHEGDSIRAEAIFVSNHHKVPSIEVRVTNQDGTLICHVTGMGYRKSTPLPKG